MNVPFSMRWYGTTIALALCCAAALLAWLTGETAWLLAAIVVACAAVLGFAIEGRRTDAVTRQAERETRLIVESMPGMGWSTDAQGRFKYLNPSVFEYTGRRCAAGEGAGFGVEVLHPDEADRVVKHWMHCLETGDPYESEHRLRRADGVYRWFRAVARPSRDAKGRITGWYGLTQDIDDRKKAEEALRASESGLKSIVESIPGMIAVADSRGKHAYANRRLLDYIGMELSGGDNHPWIDVVHPEERDAVWTERDRAVAAGEPFEITYRRRRFDGVYRWFRVGVEPVRDEHGKIVGWYSLLVDVHEQKVAEKALRKSEQQLRLLIDTIPALVWCATPSGEPFYLNKRMLDYAGLQPDEAAQSRFKIIHPEDLAELKRLWVEAIAANRSFRIIYRLRRADGVYRWHEGRAEPWRDRSGAIVQWYGVNVDIDERLRAEQALRTTQASFQRAAQLAGLAELSASIAHEVNQPLAAVVTNSHACRRWLSAEPPNLQRALLTAERIIRDANAAAEVVSRVRALFKQTAQGRRSPVDLNEVVAEVCSLLADDIAARQVRIETCLEAGLPRVLADRVQMQQVLVNLVRNGIDAMESIGGPRSLEIRSRHDATGMASIEVRDHGRGIEDAEKIFEPFFTTKSDGMGMGLAISRSIVEAHDGRLSVAKADPTGTAFVVTLPVHAGAPA